MAKNTVTIVNKLPNGIFAELGYDPKTGDKAESKFVQVYFKGANTGSIVNADGSKVGITENVDAEFAEAWFKAHATKKMVKLGLVSMLKTLKSAKDYAKDANASVKTGRDPLTKADIDKSTNPGVSTLEVVPAQGSFR